MVHEPVDQWGARQDITYPPELEEFRGEVRAVLAEELPPQWRGLGALPTAEQTAVFVNEWRATLHRRGLLAVAWPATYGGRGLTKLHQVVLVEELARAGVPYGRVPLDLTGLKMLGNTLLTGAPRSRSSGICRGCCPVRPASAKGSPNPAPVPTWRRSRPRLAARVTSG